MERVSGLSLPRFGSGTALIALIVSFLVLPAQQPASGATTAAETCSISDTNKTFAGGSGSSGNPFLISSAGNLETLKNCVEAGNTNYSASTVYFLQTADINWIDDTVIGSDFSKPFRANYDGGGFAIHSFSQSISGLYVGLFGSGLDCSVSDLEVSARVVNTRTSTGATTGIVMAHSRGCEFDSLTVYGTVSGGTYTSSTHTGGIVGSGQSGTSPRETTIQSSTAHVDVTGRSQENGGVIGYLEDGSISTVVVSRQADPWDSNQARGNIVVSAHDATAGGIAGYTLRSTFSGSSSSVDLTGTYTTASTGQVGGLVGFFGSGGSVSTSSTSGTLTFNDTVGAVNRAGGLVGEASGSISDSFSTATLNVFVDSTSRSVGGLVGTAGGGVDKSYFAGSINVDEKTGVDLTHIGGLVGNLTSAVTKSYANATMTGDATAPAGLVGRNASGSITDSFAYGSVTAAKPAGLVGNNGNTNVSNSFTLTQVAGGSSDLYPVRSAGSNVASTVYWNASRAGESTEPFPSGATRLTDSEFATQSSFTGFDFSSTWTMGTCAPYLTWIGSSPTGLCPAVAPNAPTLTTVTAGDGQLTVAFTAGSDGGATITNYKYSTDGTNYTALSPADASTPVTITGLTNGTSYSVTLKAVNSVGDSAASNSLSGTPVAPAPSASPSPSPSPSPSLAPTPEPDSTPAPRPAAASTPPAKPPVVSTPARPSSPPAPTPPPAAAPQPPPAIPEGPGIVVLRAEELFEGAITLGNDTEEVVMPAFVLEDIAQRLAPDGAPLEDGALVIESGATMIAVLIIQLGDVRLAAADMGDYIQFTLNVPGFESSSMTVAVQKQALMLAFWVQMGLLAVSAAIAVIMIWWFVAINRRRKSDDQSGARRIKQGPPPPPVRPEGAPGI